MDGARIMIHADEGRHVMVLYWDNSGGTLSICCRQQNWDPNDSDDVQYAVGAISDGVPLAGWMSLAKSFLERFETYK